jgi:hypothetical protein
MKKLGTISLICAGFIAGIAFVYSCGGGGSSSGAAATIGELEARVIALEAKLANVVINNNPLVGLSGPHFIFSGVNVHVRNGAAQSNTTNGVGNLILGYNESTFADSTERAGSHNLVIGQEHEYSRYNGLVAGYNNRLEGVHSTVSGGSGNAAIGAFSNVAGGNSNAASGHSSSVTGGRFNIASSSFASVTGGQSNEASFWYATVTGGAVNIASDYYAVVSGGLHNEARGNGSSISGGDYNVASGIVSSVNGGYSNSAGGYSATISGGSANSTGGSYASISGGNANSAGGLWASISGGRANSAGGGYASISGGWNNWAGGNYASVSGGNSNSAPANYQSDETPDYDSGWQSLAANNDVDFVHNLGGSADDYTVVLDQKETSASSTHGINNHYVGGGIYNYPARADLGSFWVLLTNSSIKVRRNPDSTEQLDEVRIRIWANKS